MKRVGIVGMPNVGKSSLFNLLTNSKVPTSIYPFCTIQPNYAKLAVPDKRLFKLASLINAIEVIPASIELVDIAGLVQNASKGEGLGNQFLSYVLNVDLLLHVVRGFIDERVTYSGQVPVEDLEVVNLELILKDIEFIERRIHSLKNSAEVDTLNKLKEFLEKGNLALDFEGIDRIDIPLLTKKPMIYVLNINDAGKSVVDEFEAHAKKRNIKFFILDVLFELELLSLEDTEREELGIKKENKIIDELINMIYKELNLLTFFTIERGKLRAWGVTQGTSAYTASGFIHSDIQKGFVKAEVVNFKDLENIESNLKIASTADLWHEARSLGLTRFESRNYLIKDADIISFKFTS